MDIAHLVSALINLEWLKSGGPDITKAMLPEVYFAPVQSSCGSSSNSGLIPFSDRAG